MVLMIGQPLFFLPSDVIFYSPKLPCLSELKMKHALEPGTHLICTFVGPRKKNRNKTQQKHSDFDSGFLAVVFYSSNELTT